MTRFLPILFGFVGLLIGGAVTPATAEPGSWEARQAAMPYRFGGALAGVIAGLALAAIANSNTGHWRVVLRNEATGIDSPASPLFKDKAQAKAAARELRLADPAALIFLVGPRGEHYRVLS